MRLTGEAIGGFFDVDGRLWRTLPSLCVRPARLTRSFLKGHRVTQVPPFRLFLVAVVLVFLVAGIEPQELPRLNLSQPAGRASLQTGSDVNLNFGPGNAVPSNKDPVSKWLTARVRSVAKNPQRFEASLAAWAQRMAILALPLSAGLLGLMFFWRRGVYLFDHLIFSMHSLSFQGLLLASSMLLSQLSGWFGLMLVAAPVHLFAHLKGTYRLGVFGTLARMAVLFLGSLVGFAVALLLLVAIGLYEVGA